MDRAKNGVDEEMIKQCGRWTSCSYLHYIHTCFTMFLGSNMIWFIGSSIVYWAQRNTHSRYGGPNGGCSCECV
jgi:hypothetical protein